MKVIFSCREHMSGVIPAPVSSLRVAPQYFRSVKPQINNNPKSGTVKRCVPFLDALSSGFIISLWADMYVVAKNGDIEINFPPTFPQEETLGTHPESQIPDHPLSKNKYGNIQLKFINPWIVKTESGVSCLFTSPLNHMETRWKLLDGIVDTDTYYNNINFPFIWTGGDGEFFVPKGTPLVQVIPFRREQYELEISVTDIDNSDRVKSILGTKLKNAYRDEFWHKKKSPENKSSAVEDEIQEDIYAPVQTFHVSDKTENEPDQLKIEELKSPQFESGSSSGILEVVVDNDLRGFGEGTF